MAEFTVKHAARKTRQAISKVHRALAALDECEAHWRDLDNCVAEDVVQAASVPTAIAQLSVFLDEEYPATKSRGRKR